MASSTRTVLVTGGLGFLGRQVASALLRQHAARASLGERLVVKLVDVRGGAAGVDEDAALASDVLEDALGAGADDADAAVEVLRGDISDAQFCERAVGHDTDSVFHLAAIMSGQGEADFDAAISVNLHGTLNLLEAVRGSGSSGAKFVFASTGAVFGSDAAAGNKRPSTTITDATKQLPESSYGMTKSCCELLVNDYTRRGFVVGRSARLPTVVVRPGSPNAATTSVFSSVVREPLAGVDCVSPLPLDLPHAVVSHRTAVDSILRLHDIDEGEFLRLAPLAGVDRAVNLHATTVTLSELHAEAERVAASTSSSSSSRAPFGAVHLEVDDALSTIVSSMPSNIESDTAAALGLPGQGHTARDLVRIYCEDFAPSMSVAATEGDSGVEGASEKDRRVVAFLGLGNMGKSMARNVVSSGKFDEVRVWNRTQDTAQSFAVSVENVHSRSATTVTVCDSPREAAKGAGVSLMCLGTEQACEEVLLDPDHGILTAADREGTDSVIVDHSTVSPGLSERCHIAAAGAGSGVKFLDGPISGGPEGASDGTLSIMCGGEDEAFGAARSVLECMGEKVVHMGPAGAGTAAKLVNQLLVGIHATASSEALALAKALDLDLGPDGKLVPLLAASWGQSRVLERNGAVIAAADGDFASRDLESSQAPLRNLVKDLEIIIDAARDDLDLDLRAAEVATAVYKHYAKTGFGGADMAIAARYYGLPSLQARGRKRAGITRDQSWAWADIYDGGGGIS